MFERGTVVKLHFNGSPNRCKSRTHQSFAQDANINNIMGRYKTTGLLVDPLRVNPNRRPNFGDFSDLTELPVTLDRIRKAEESFLVLPAALRERFSNDVSQLLDFVSDSKNVEEAVKLKLLPESALPKKEDAKAPVVPAPTVTPPVDVKPAESGT